MDAQLEGDQEQERLLTPQDLAQRFQVPVTWVYGACRPRANDPLPYVKVGRYLRFEESAVREYLQKRKRRGL